MKLLAYLAISIGLICNLPIKKIDMSYAQAALKADLIVEGAISDVSFFAYEYDFIILDFIKGKSENKVKINMWKEWTCDRRIKKPKKNQKLLLFLTQRESGEYDIINGSTGELFVSESGALETFVEPDLPNLTSFKQGLSSFLEAASDSEDYLELDHVKKIMIEYQFLWR